jgi:hypothetical protein
MRESMNYVLVKLSESTKALQWYRQINSKAHRIDIETSFLVPTSRESREMYIESLRQTCYATALRMLANS